MYNFSDQLIQVLKKEGIILCDVSNFKNDSSFSFLQSFEQRFQSQYSQVKSRFHGLPEIKFALLESASLNACALKANSEYFIGLNLGAVFLLGDLFTRMLADKHNFQDIGNPRIESENVLPFNFKRINQEVFYDLSGRTGVMPKDLIRIEFASVLFNLAITYLINHEICHIIRGHVDFLRENNIRYNLKESVDNSDSSSIDSYFQQFLELDADSYATTRAFDTAFLLEKGKVSLPPRMQAYVGSVEKYFQYFIFAIYTLHKLFGFEKFKTLPTYFTTHPPATIRARFIIAKLLDLIELKEPTLSETISPRFTAGILEAEIAFSKLTGEDNGREIVSASIEAGQNYIDQLEGRNHEVYSRIKPYSYIGVPVRLKA